MEATKKSYYNLRYFVGFFFPVKYHTFGPTGLMERKERDLGSRFSLRVFTNISVCSKDPYLHKSLYKLLRMGLFQGILAF